MKNFLLAITLTGIIALGALYYRQSDQLKLARRQIRELQANAEKLESEAQQAAAAAAKLKEMRARVNESTLSAVQKSTEVVKLQGQLAAAQTNAAGGAKGFGEMFKSPEMREMIKAQQKAVMGPMLDKTYGPLFAQLNLSADQKSYLRDLMEKKMMASADAGMELMGGDADPAKRAELTKTIKDTTDAYNEQIKSFLGDANYAQYESYEKTQPERMQLSQFRDQLASSQTPLSADQEQQLVQAMATERANFKWTTDYANANKDPANLAEMFSEDHLNAFAQEKAQYDQVALARAQQILGPDQYKSFEQFLTSQTQMQITAMKLGAKMLAPGPK